MKRVRTVAWFLAGGLALVVVFFCLIIAYYIRIEPSLIYAPSRTSEELGSGLAYRAQRISIAADGAPTLVGWILRADTPTKKWVYFMYGNAGNAATYTAYWNVIHQLHANVFVLDYRGFGESTGIPSESGIYVDVESGYKYLLSEQSVAPGDLVLYGHSLGSAVAIHLASRVRAAGLIVDGAMLSIPALAEESHPYLPVGFIARMAHNTFDSYDTITSVNCPKLFLHALDDKVVPISEARALYRRSSEPKAFVELSGDHINAVTSDPRAAAAIEAFLRQVLTSTIP